MSTTSSQYRVRRQDKENSRSLLDRYSNSWYPEALALTFSSACAIATGVILGYYNNKPSPKIAGLTLNAIVATLGAGAEASLIFAVSNSIGQLKWVWFGGTTPRPLLDAEIFDDASRGPLGSCKMLFAGTRRSAASLGAMLTVLAIAFNPFVQLVIDYRTTTLYSTDSNGASINRAGLYEVNLTTSTATYAYNSAWWRDDFVWQASHCSTNCLWNNFTTLAWENKCYEDKNWTSVCDLKISTEDFVMNNDSAYSRPCLIKGEPSYDPADPWQTAFGYSLNFKEDDAGWQIYGSLTFPKAATLMTFFGPKDWAEWIAGERVPPDVGSREDSPFLMISTFEWQLESDWTLGLKRVTTCELDLFIHTYFLNSTGTSVNATLQDSQKLTKSYVMPTYTYGKEGRFEGICLKSDVGATGNGTWFSPLAEALNGREEVFKWYNPSNATQYCQTSDSMEDRWPQSDFLAGQQNLSFELTDYLENNGTSDNILQDWYGYHDASDILGDSHIVSSTDAFDVWIDEGPERTMNNIAAAFTQLGLSSSLNTNGTEVIFGQVGRVVSLVRVRWLWLILPYGLCLAGILFLLLTAYLSNRAGLPLWKSSINALLYHGIDYDHGSLEPLATIPEMDDQAERTRAQLRRSGIMDKFMLETTV